MMESVKIRAVTSEFFVIHDYFAVPFVLCVV